MAKCKMGLSYANEMSTHQDYEESRQKQHRTRAERTFVQVILITMGYTCEHMYVSRL